MVLIVIHNSQLTRRRALAGMAGFAALVSTRNASAQTPAITPQKLSDRLTVFMGDGGNISILSSPDGLFMVDGGFAERAPELAAAIANTRQQPVSQLFDTHWHGDHVGSNVYLGRKGVKIIAHDNARVRLSSTVVMEAFNRTVEPLAPAGIPGVTFHEPGAISFGSTDIHYTPVPPAHTDGDAYLFFPDANVLHTGDLLFNGFYPFIDYSTKGWIGGMIAAEAQMLAAADEKKSLKQGQRPIKKRADLQAAHDMLSTVHDRMLAMAKQGKTVQEAVSAKPTAEFDPKWGGGMMKPDSFVTVAYTSILRHQKETA